MKKAVVMFFLLCVLGASVFADGLLYEKTDDGAVDGTVDGNVMEEPDDSAADGAADGIADGVVMGEPDEDDISDVLRSLLQQEVFVGREDVEAPNTMETLGRPSVALVLSGGGAKGIAHIAVIEALEKYGIPIDKVFGTSMGALIGGLYAAGLSPAEMKEVVRGNDLMHLFTAFESSGYNEVLDAFDFNSNNVLSLSLGQGIGGVSGIIDDYMILNFLTSYVGNVPDGIDFEKDLVVPFECNAANLLNGNEVIFTGGNLITAMRSSMSIPIVFEPVVISDDLVLVDGGAVCNYIVHRAVEEGYDLVIVVTLDGYRRKKDEATAEDLTSLSGVLGASIGMVLDNVSRGELALTDIWFSPDTTDYTTFSFSEANAILEAGEKMVEEESFRFKLISDLFTEGQKVFKDPNRVGEYYSKYKVKTKEEHLASRETRHEDLLGMTRLSIGMYGGGGYGFYLKKDSNEDTWRAFYPTLSLRSFIKDVGGSIVSLDTRIKSTMNWSTDVSVMALFRFSPDYGLRIFGMNRIRGSVGSLSYITDSSSIIRVNVIEGLVALDVGMMVTNEHDRNILFYFSADNTWYLNEEFEQSYGFIPSATVEAVFYPDYTNGFFSVEGGRYDMIASVGYYTNSRKWFYKLAFAAENTFKINRKLSLWYDFTAYSNHSEFNLRSSYEEYGGWDGMPGYATGTLYGEFITLGIGAQYLLSKSFTSTYIAAVIRGGVRADVKYANAMDKFHKFTTFVPFKECLQSGLWDLGISVGYGIGTPVGDIIIGAGFNMNLQLSLYVELT